MFIAVSHFAVADDPDDLAAVAFARRPHAADTAPGFPGLEVWRAAAEPRRFALAR